MCDGWKYKGQKRCEFDRTMVQGFIGMVKGFAREKRLVGWRRRVYALGGLTDEELETGKLDLGGGSKLVVFLGGRSA